MIIQSIYLKYDTMDVKIKKKFKKIKFKCHKQMYGSTSTISLHGSFEKMSF